MESQVVLRSDSKKLMKKAHHLRYFGSGLSARS